MSARTYKVTLHLDARHEPAVRRELERAFGSTVAMLARVEPANPLPRHRLSKTETGPRGRKTP